MRFCYVTTFYPPYNFGGDGLTSMRQAEALAEQGHEVDVVFLPGAFELLSGTSPKVPARESKVRTHGFRNRFEKLSLLGAQQSGRPLGKAKALKEFLSSGFDVIHFHNISLWGPEILSYGNAVKLLTLHEYWLICPTHVMFRFNRQACQVPRFCSLCTLVQKRPPQLWRASGLLPRMIKNIDCILAASHFTKNLHQRYFQDQTFAHLPHFTPAPCLETPVKRETGTFLFVGRLEKIKGLQTLIPVFRRLPGMKLMVVGDGTMMDELRAETKNMPSITFHGHLEGDALERLFYQATAVIVPSLTFEISPGVIMEAYARRTPVIARDIGSIPEFIGTAGFLYETEEMLMHHIQKLADDPGLGRTLGDIGYQKYTENWTAERYLDRYLSIIDGVVSGREDYSVAE
jgi:glycosyltransferase involved in cell wall biosynthesis